MTSRMSCSMIRTPQPSLSLIREIRATSSSALRFVQARRWFIEEEKLRARRDGAGDADPLLLPERKLLGGQMRPRQEARPIRALRRPVAWPPVARGRHRRLRPRRSRKQSRPRNRRTFWKVRANPLFASRLGDQIVTVSSPSVTVPLLSGTKPLSAFMSVVLPAPFGPIRPRISPGSSLISTPSTALTPSK